MSGNVLGIAVGHTAELTKTISEQDIVAFAEVTGAGGAAHLAGVIASKTSAPVIGLPIPSEHLRGLDSLLSIVQMPKGVPVATVAIGGAENAALLAAQILSLKYPSLRERLDQFRLEQAQAVLADPVASAGPGTDGRTP
jgi:phosphoribosylaminoimidazole carboxylase PurE protein